MQQRKRTQLFTRPTANVLIKEHKKSTKIQDTTTSQRKAQSIVSMNQNLRPTERALDPSRFTPKKTAKSDCLKSCQSVEAQPLLDSRFLEMAEVISQNGFEFFPLGSFIVSLFDETVPSNRFLFSCRLLEETGRCLTQIDPINSRAHLVGLLPRLVSSLCDTSFDKTFCFTSSIRSFADGPEAHLMILKLIQEQAPSASFARILLCFASVTHSQPDLFSLQSEQISDTIINNVHAALSQPSLTARCSALQFLSLYVSSATSQTLSPSTTCAMFERQPFSIPIYGANKKILFNTEYTITDASEKPAGSSVIVMQSETAMTTPSEPARITGITKVEHVNDEKEIRLSWEGKLMTNGPYTVTLSVNGTSTTTLTVPFDAGGTTSTNPELTRLLSISSQVNGTDLNTTTLTLSGHKLPSGSATLTVVPSSVASGSETEANIINVTMSFTESEDDSTGTVSIPLYPKSTLAYGETYRIVSLSTAKCIDATLTFAIPDEPTRLEKVSPVLSDDENSLDLSFEGRAFDSGVCTLTLEQAASNADLVVTLTRDEDGTLSCSISTDDSESPHAVFD
ncbi:hypothetical protein BLNAU_23142 [Blattamonas nauphoetae]|uniref:Uncharacterized protein n=1 Tax=Blattamonas nauphoetae TaxID=2049346 RepID=A0ABQ9WR46_9EUKA|nr:hypothetical protein BLNAU_23142 [Blattamonas nauphoetae]